MVDWQPEQTGVQQICQLLAEYQKPGSNQEQIYQQLKQFNAIPDFNNYLAYILSAATNFPVEVRQSAGLLLKNNMSGQYAAMSQQNRQYIQACLVAGMALPSRPLRQTAGTAVASIVGVAGLAAWPELLQVLGRSIECPDVMKQEGALDTVLKICEDFPQHFEAALLDGTSGVGAQLLHLFLKKFNSEHASIKRLAVSILNIVTRDVEEGFDEVLNMYLKGLFALAHDRDSEIRKEVCAGMIRLMVNRPNMLRPFMQDIIKYMLQSTQDADEHVALESCEFWTAFVEAQIEPDVLRPFLPEVVPILLKNMIYSDDDEAVAEARDAENEVEETEKDMQPFHAGRAEERGGGAEANGFQDEEGNGSWTLRKCSAAGLDLLSEVFGDELLTVLQPIVWQRLQDSDWKARESAILVLGAIAEGCRQGLEPFLDEMLSILLPKLKDTQPLVRIISCWALGRYSKRIIWRAANGGAPANGGQQVDAIFEGLLTCVLDKNKQVQKAACSALAMVEELAGTNLLSQKTQIILEHLALACQRYTRKNLRILYDSLRTLADQIGLVLATPAYRGIIMPPLLQKWQIFDDTDRELLPLLECFMALAMACRDGFEEYAKPMFERCVRIISMQLEAKHAIQAAQPTSIPWDKDFIVSSLDLLSGLVEGLGTSMASLVGVSRLRELLLECCEDEAPDVRQGAFALVGDLARSCMQQLLPSGKEFCDLAVRNMEPGMVVRDNLSACNNACWCLGELAMKLPVETIRPIALQTLNNCVNILLNSHSMQRSLLENAAITLGRVSLVSPEQLAEYLPHFMGPWCQTLRCIRDDTEKEHAFMGLFRLIRLNPAGSLASFQSFCEAVSSWHRVQNEELQFEMTSIVQSYKEALVAQGQWVAVWSHVPDAVQSKIQIMCGAL
ncbi:hypothetical protein BSKO_13759 [Bryopsis sp. KO-2023]|nr:hypothetical protein BSKO_13759 [Bryopsis sp. KO-2023]